MAAAPRPHILAVDDGPVDKRTRVPVDLVAVMMEGADLVECVAVSQFDVDGPDATGFLADWISGLRCRPALQAVVLGGVTIAGLGVVDIHALSQALGIPAIVVNRQLPGNERVEAALRSAGLGARMAIIERMPAPFEVRPGLYAAAAGATPDTVCALLAGALGKSNLPEPLRLAHVIARAITDGESRGRA